MALVKGTNSYATVAEANSYFADRLDVAAWTSADDTQKGQALVTATSYLDELDWTGIAVSDSQLLAFPRAGTYFDPRMGTEVFFDEAEVPVRITVATYELAYHLLNNDGLLDDTGSVESLNIGSLTLSKIKSPNKIPTHVRKNLRPLLLNKGSSNWWRAG